MSFLLLLYNYIFQEGRINRSFQMVYFPHFQNGHKKNNLLTLVEVSDQQKKTVVELAFWNANMGEQEGWRARQMIGWIVSDSGPELSCLHSSHSVVYWFVCFPNKRRRREPEKVNRRKKIVSAPKASSLKSEISLFQKAMILLLLEENGQEQKKR